MRRIPLPLAIAVTVVVIYHPTLHAPFLFDDWQIVADVGGQSLAEVAKAVFWPRDALFYRPLGILWVWLSYRVFGLNTLPHHLLVLTFHTLSGVLIYRICRQLALDVVLAALVALSYVGALKIHLDPLLNCVGICDVAGVLLFFGSLWLSLRRQPLAAAAPFALALLFKESVVLLPIVVAAWCWLLDAGSVRERFARTFSALRWHSLVLAFYLSVRMAVAISPSQLPPDHPYRVQVGAHVAANLLRYANWALQAPVSYTPEWPVYALLLPLAIGWIVWHPRTSMAQRLASLPARSPSRAVLWLLAVWAVVGLLPVLFLPNHCYRYYLVYSLPPLLALGWTALRACALALLRRPAFANALIVGLTVSGLLSSAVWFRRANADRAHSEGVSGTSALLRAWDTTLRTQRALPSIDPHVDTVVLEGVDLLAFRVAAGPRVWLRRPDLRVLDAAALDGVRLDPERTVRLRP